MKKVYINPETKIVKVELQHMIASSPLDPAKGQGQVVEEQVGSGTPGESRGGRGFWDDEEDY